MRLCHYCQRMVEPRKHVDLFPFVFMTFITGGTWIAIYGVYYFFSRKAAVRFAAAKNGTTETGGRKPAFCMYIRLTKVWYGYIIYTEIKKHKYQENEKGRYLLWQL